MNVIEINRRRVFNLEEAQELLPIVWKITQTYSRRVHTLLSRIEAIQGQSQLRTGELEQEVNELVQEWQTKMEKLGMHTKGLWIADFDSGDGYYCWKFPEEKIQFWHKYSDGFSGRRPLDTMVSPNSPSVHTQPEINA